MDTNILRVLLLKSSICFLLIHAREIHKEDYIDFMQYNLTIPQTENTTLMSLDLFLTEHDPVFLTGNSTMEILINILRNTSKVQDEDILFHELESFGTDIHRHMIEIQIRSCPYTQLCNVHRETYDYPGYLKPCCGACSCDLEVCLDTNNCCLDIILNSSTQFPPRTKLSKSCIPLEIGQTSGVGYRSHIYAVSSCTRHKDHSKYISIDKCENEYIAWGVGRVIDIVPCFDRLNRTLFRNRHCAYCNGVLDVELEYFNASLTCETLNGGSRDDTVLLDKILNKKSCKITFHPEPEFEISLCTGAVNSCNQTGLWTIYNADIETACLAYTSVYSLGSLSELSRFKNIFCYICNGYDPNDLRQLCQITFYTDTKSEIFSFSGLLNVQRSLDDMSAVRVNENPDEENTFCSIARSLVGEECVPMGATVWNILVLLDIRAIPEQRLYMNMSEIDTMLLRLYDAIKDRFGPGFDDNYCSRGASADMHASAETMLSSESFVNVVVIDFCIPLYVSTPIEIDSFFNGFREALQNVKINVFLDGNKSLKFSLNIIDKSNHPYDYLGDKGQYKRSLGEFGALANNSESVELPPGEFPFGIGSTAVPNSNQYQLNEYYRPLERRLRYDIIDSKIRINISYPNFEELVCFGFHNQVLNFLHLIDCPLINISRSNSSWITLQNGNIKMEGGYEISSDRYYISGPDSIAICINSYKNFTSYLKHMSGKSLKYSPEVIVSIVCVGLSILCLLVSLAAYTAFPKLRHSLPGWNVMTLVSILFIAQVLYLISNLGGFQSGALTCKVIGILVHFSWLLCLFWMNVCTFHMFRVLTKMTVIRSGSKWKRYFLYLSYAFFMSTMFTGVNIIVSVARESGFGYGKYSCYIDTQEMVMCTFALPAALIIVSNFVMFVSVIIKIKRSPSVQKNVKNERNDLEIFVKLSTITGMTWIFGLINSVTQISFFSYLFIVLNASQGVFLFFAFICNRRVYSMLTNLVYGTPELSTTGNTISTTAC